MLVAGRRRALLIAIAASVILSTLFIITQPELVRFELSLVWNSRADEVRAAFLHAYRGYQRYASGRDELRPVSNESVNNFNGWGVTLIDGLDTMWIMGLYGEFYDAMPFIANATFALNESEYAPFFETVIRYLGGLLSAYALSNETILLSRADDLGQKLLPVFNTSSGMPMYAVNTVNGRVRQGWAPGSVLYAEAMSCQMEYKYLAHLTGRAEYFEKVDAIMDIVARAPVKEGMFPTRWSLQTAVPQNYQFSVGALADSAHEYLLKQWLLSSRVESKAKDLYLRTVSSILEHLLYLSPTRHLLYVTDAETSHQNFTSPSHVFEHLSCFLPGLLTLGAHTLLSASDLSNEQRQLHQWAAEGLANTCWITYADHISGLGPDEVRFSSLDFVFSDDAAAYVPKGAQVSEERMGRLLRGKWLDHVKEWENADRPGGIPPGVRDPEPVLNGQRDYLNNKAGYLLRPETVESFYLLYRTTGDIKWRERGWTIFKAIQHETRTPSGYASIYTVEQSPSPKKDEMPSFFMAETLKYLYLLFREEDIIPLDKWVFNTEAHPLPVFEWSAWEKTKYGIS
ncbi:glycoside hydrolase [Cristinia sonorae]|uniref:alpha-1,2-Mannosidase n=1 Tax=Cristinia sonorae TaxID=1940300 RepID=A0A8K0UV10_9AGAR|nr:glycoside hydrolase [Cristinia sonorae]